MEERSWNEARNDITFNGGNGVVSVLASAIMALGVVESKRCEVALRQTPTMRQR